MHEAFSIDELIEGEASGVDTLAREWAEENDILVWPFPADWDNIRVPGAVVKERRDGTKYNKAAGVMRNRQMLSEGEPSLVVAFSHDIWKSRGTLDMITIATEASVPVMIFNVSREKL